MTLNQDSWRNDKRVASHWTSIDGSTQVECTLCPRHCKPHAGQTGFCRVRANEDGVLYSHNYGRSVAATLECIETEAVFHYRPGAPILSMGNVGCMMACTYCQNWETSQVKHLDARSVHAYTPESVVEIAKANGIKVISWTYNDPVVWHEFVIDASIRAREAGIQTLYKSALYIEEKPLRELTEVIDIFSVSLKSMSPDFYHQLTKGRLEPVLDALKILRDCDSHLEVSQLLVTELNDKDQDVLATVDWVLENLGAHVPLHFVRFHPAYKYLDVERTPVSIMQRSREIALERGMEHCYLGNLYQDGAADTTCVSCGNLLVRRFGLTVDVVGVDATESCANCGQAAPIVQPFGAAEDSQAEHGVLIPTERANTEPVEVRWSTEVNSIHVGLREGGEESVSFEVTRHPGGATRQYHLSNGLRRVIFSKSDSDETGVRILSDLPDSLEVMTVLDRAHFPVGHTDTGEESEGAHQAVQAGKVEA